MLNTPDDASRRRVTPVSRQLRPEIRRFISIQKFTERREEKRI